MLCFNQAGVYDVRHITRNDGHGCVKSNAILFIQGAVVLVVTRDNAALVDYLHVSVAGIGDNFRSLAPSNQPA